MKSDPWSVIIKNIVIILLLIPIIIITRQVLPQKTACHN